MNDTDDVDQSAAMTSAGNGGAGCVEQDGKTVTENESEEGTPLKQQCKRNVSTQLTLPKRWVTGELAEMEEEVAEAVYHLDITSLAVIFSQSWILCIQNMTSPWFLCNVSRPLSAGGYSS